MTAATFEQVHAEFGTIVDAMPADYAYERVTPAGKPLYVHGEVGALTCGCIAGHWLHYCRGVPLERLTSLEGISAPSVVLQLMATDVLPIDLLDHPTSAQLLKFLQALQSYQDMGATWREAVDTAHRLVTTPPWSLLLAPAWAVAGGAPVEVGA